MPTIPTMLAFALAALALILIPGPSQIYIVSRGIDQGRRAALSSVLGIQVGALLHIAAAALGLTALVASSPLTFNLVRYAGAAYLIWMGISHWRSRSGDVMLSTFDRQPNLRRVFGQGVVVMVLNPKAGIFFLAFFPQFIDPGLGNTALQVLVLGGIFALIAAAVDSGLAMGSGSLGRWLARNARVGRYRGRFAGAMYMALGTVAALTGSSSAKQ